MFLVVVPVVKANTFYVATTGNDAGLGTQTQPWKTIQHAVDAMAGGDTVYVRGGTYNERVLFWYRSNTTGSYMTLINYLNEGVIIDGTGIDIQHGEGLVHIQKTDYVRISGITVQHSNGAGIEVSYANNIKIDDNYTYDTVKSGISTWGATNVVIDNNDIELACNSHPGYESSEENISIASGSTNVEVKNNLVHKAADIGAPGHIGAGGEGINIKDGSHNVRVHHNVVHLDERPDGGPSTRLAFGVDAWAAHTYDIKIYDNIAYNSAYGFILESEAGGLGEDLWVYNNIAYNMVHAGYSIPSWGVAGPVSNLHFINNVAYKCDYGFWGQHSNFTNVEIRNNIFSQISNNPRILLVPGSEVNTLIDHNLFDGSGSVLGSNSVVGDPKFVNPAGANFHLQDGSPAIDKGLLVNAPTDDFDGNSRPQGAGFDIGAYEYVSGVTPTQIPPSPTAMAGRPGDANGDGNVDGVDYVIWLNHYNQSTTSGSSVGDYNSDGNVDGVDYVVWLNNYEK
jgi:hypothetical protein